MMMVDSQTQTFEVAGQVFIIGQAMTHHGETVQTIANASQQVALKYRQPATRAELGKYAFVVRANISLAWIELGDIDFLIRRMGGCCGGNQRMYRYANESDVRRWTNGGGR